jgi:hypothetical protein
MMVQASAGGGGALAGIVVVFFGATLGGGFVEGFVTGGCCDVGVCTAGSFAATGVVDFLRALPEMSW